MFNGMMLIFRKEKEMVKAMETPEEKRARRLAKKVSRTDYTYTVVKFFHEQYD